MLGGSRGELGIPVVLAEEDHRELPDGSEVQCLVERTLSHGAVTEERHGHAAVGPQLRCRRRPRGNGHAGGDDAVGPENADPGISDVHGAAAAAVRALVLAHQLREHADRLQALGQTVAVTAMGRGDDVRRRERPACSDSGRLLPGREVDETGNLAVPVERRHALLEAADQQHSALHLHEVDRREGRSERRVGRASNVYCTGRYNTRETMIEQIDIPDSFPGPGAVSGKRVVITGASRGLGALLSHAFSQAGASVALVARTERDLKAVAQALPGASLVLSGDVTDEDFNEAVADATVAEWGGIDAWICNAGISPIVAGPRGDRGVDLAAGHRGQPHRGLPRRRVPRPGSWARGGG